MQHPLDNERPRFIWRFVRMQTWTEQERQRNGTTSFTFSERFSTEIRKVTEKVVMTQAPKCTPKFTGKSRSGKASRLLRISFKKGSCQKEEFRYLLSRSRMCKIQITSRIQIRRQVCAQTHMKREIQQLLQFTLHRMMNGRCNYGKFSRMPRPNSEWGSIISRTGMFWMDLEISEIKTLRHSRKESIEWTFNMEETTRKAVWNLHKNM